MDPTIKLYSSRSILGTRPNIAKADLGNIISSQEEMKDPSKSVTEDDKPKI